MTGSTQAQITGTLKPIEDQETAARKRCGSENKPRTLHQAVPPEKGKRP